MGASKVLPPPRWLITGTTIALIFVLCAAVLTIWVTERWSVSAFQGGVLVLGMAWAVCMIFSPYSVRLHPALLPFAGAIAIGILQLAMRQTVNRWQTWNAVLGWFVYLVSFLLACQVFALPDSLARLRRALLYFAFGLSVAAMLQFFTSPGKIFWLFEFEYWEDVLGPFVSRDHYAAFIELVLPIALFEALRDRLRRLTFTLMAATMVASVIAGASRAGSILVLAECIVVMLLASHRRFSRATKMPLAFAGSLMLCILAFGMIVGWAVLLRRFEDRDPYRGRRELLLSAIAMTHARPWIGFGLGNFENAYPAYALFDTGDTVDHAHNDWAEWAAEGGLPFFACVLALAMWAAPRAIRSLWGLGVVSVFLHSLVDYPMQKPALALWVFVLLGALVAQPPKRSSDTPDA